MTHPHWGDGDPEHKDLYHLKGNWEEDWEKHSSKFDLYNFLTNDDVFCVIIGLRFFTFAIKKGIIYEIKEE